MRWVPAGSFARWSSAQHLWRAWLTYARGKRRWTRVAHFAIDADTHVLALHRALTSQRYTPAPYRQHVVRDPKIRLISAPDIRDRVLHQAIVSDIGHVYTRSYIHDTYACLVGRGPQRAVRRYLAWTRRHQWRLSLDIRRYFPSIEHERLLAVIFARLRDPQAQRLLRQLIEHGGSVYTTPLAVTVLNLERDPVPPGTGLPIGSCLSQWAANLYLDGLDQYVKRALKMGAYLRYMDDMSLFADDRDRLEECRAAIEVWLLEQRGLTLNRKRWHVIPAGQPSTYLGYRISRAGLGPGRKVRRRMRDKVRVAGARGPDSLRETLQSYRALVLVD